MNRNNLYINDTFYYKCRPWVHWHVEVGGKVVFVSLSGLQLYLEKSRLM